MKIENVSIAKVIPYIRNPRKNENAVEKVASSIKEFGFRQPIVVDEESVIIAGHTRYESAKRLGMETVPVHVAKGLTPQQVKAYRIADNRVGQEAEWDMDLLKLELEELDNPELTGFDPDELQNILAELEEGLTDDDYVPEVPDDPFTRTGDLWELGEHRLLCGDATKAEDVERLMGGSKATLCVTDPPYSVNYEESHKTRGGDKAVHGEYHEANIDPSELLYFLKLVPSDLIIFSYSVDRHIFILSEKLKEFGWEVRKELVWVKSTFAFWKGAKYQQKHEPIWICTKNNGTFAGNVPPNETTVLEFDKPSVHKLHPTMKPVELWQKFVEYHTGIGDLVYEPFTGSGTTHIACQKTGRKCYGLEISPEYCDVIVTRWSDFTGKDDLLLNGKPFKWSERDIKKVA